MKQSLTDVVDLRNFPLHEEEFRLRCKRTLDQYGVLVLREFLRVAAVDLIRKEAQANQKIAYYTSSKHNIFLRSPDPDRPKNHPRNRRITSSKGCITTDQVPAASAMRTLYDAGPFREFLCAVLGEHELHEYADALSSINIHFADEGQELGWHYDNSSFAVTLMIQTPKGGGKFEFVKDVRDADSGEMNYELSGRVLNGESATENLAMNAGDLVLFRGRNSMHRVTPVEGDRTRILVVLAYNTEPGIALSESARMTFYGRLG